MIRAKAAKTLGKVERQGPVAEEAKDMTSSAQKRGDLIRILEEALALSEQLRNPVFGYLIERALDEARAHQFRLHGNEN